MKTCPTCSVVHGNSVGLCPVDGAVLRTSSAFEPGSIIRQKNQIISEIGQGGGLVDDAVAKRRGGDLAGASVP